MIRVMSSLLALALSVPTPSSGQTTEATAFVSPCPSVFMYEPLGTEPGKWYGSVNLTTDTTLHALWLNVVLDSKADILGNWVGEVTTEDNLDFKIENTKMRISPGPPLTIRFFIQYNTQSTIPRLQAIRFNGKEICRVDTPPGISIEILEQLFGPFSTEIGVVTPTTVRPTTTTSKSYDRQHTTSNPQYWQQTKVDNNNQQVKPENRHTTLKPQVWTQAKSEDKTQTTSRPQVWTQVDTSQSKVQTITPDKVQPITQLWSQPKDVSNQQNKSKGKQQTGTEIRPQTTKAASIHQVKPQDKNRGTKIEVTTQAQLWAQHKVENKSHTEVDKIEQTNFWPKITDNNFQVQPDRHAGATVKQPPRSESKFVIDDTSNHQSSEQTRPDDRYQRLQDSRRNQGEPRDDIPIYVRPEEKQPVSEDIYETRPRDHLQSKLKTTSYQITTEDRKREAGRLEIRPIKRPEEESVRKETWPGERTSSWSGDRTQSWTQESNGKIIFESAGDSTSYTDNDGRVKNLAASRPINAFPPTTEAPDTEEYFGNYSPKEEPKIEFAIGGLPTIYIPDHGPRKTEPTCGKVILNKAAPNQGGTRTLEGQWPWQIALYQQQTTVDFKYICGGTLVSRRHVVTAAHCVTRKASQRLVNKNTLTVYLGKHNLRTSVDGVQVKFVSRILVHPEYNATTFRRDLAILELREPVTYSDWVQPACLWPENELDLKNVVGKKGSVVGWGYDDTGVARAELSLLEMPVVNQQTCVESFAEFYKHFISDFTYCAGYRDRTTVCNGDSGGGMVFQMGQSWYLRGLSSLTIARRSGFGCDPDQYVIFTDLAKFVPWIEDNIEDF